MYDITGYFSGKELGLQSNELWFKTDHDPSHCESEILPAQKALGEEMAAAHSSRAH